MKVENGKIVKFIQKYHSPILDNWGTFEREILYPHGINKLLKSLLNNQPVGAWFNYPMPELEEREWEPTLVFRVPTANLTNADRIEKGMVFQTVFKKHPINGIVKQVKNGVATVDCNFPLNGEKNMSVYIRVTDIRDAKDSVMESPFTPKLTVL